jgi:hypothetical protein
MMDECDTNIAPDTPGGLLLKEFKTMVLEREDELSIKVIRKGEHQIRGRVHFLRQVLEHGNGIALISSGKGHCVGVSCRDNFAVDTDSAQPYPVDLRGASSLEKLADLLHVEKCSREDVRLPVLYISFESGF